MRGHSAPEQFRHALHSGLSHVFVEHELSEREHDFGGGLEVGEELFFERLDVAAEHGARGGLFFEDAGADLDAAVAHLKGGGEVGQ